MLKREEQATRFVGDTKAVRGIAGRVPVRVPTPTPDLGITRSSDSQYVYLMLKRRELCLRGGGSRWGEVTSAGSEA